MDYLQVYKRSSRIFMDTQSQCKGFKIFQNNAYYRLLGWYFSGLQFREKSIEKCIKYQMNLTN